MDQGTLFVLKVFVFLFGCCGCVGLSASKNRNVYAWGIAGAVMPLLVVVLAFLKPVTPTVSKFPTPRDAYR